MSYHIIHVLGHGSVLSVDRGCLVCKTLDGVEKRAPLADILSVIVAARGVSFSGETFSRILSNNGVILHCDENYRPCGKSLSLSSVIHSDIFARQIASLPNFSSAIWGKILRAKVINQAAALDAFGAKHELREMLDSGKIDEGNAARHYWKHYFSFYGRKGPKLRETQRAEHPVNQMLNYSYAVASSLLHRSLIIHGLNTTLGIHHRFRFKSDPLLYDLLEPLRPICDVLLLKFYKANKRKDIKIWVKNVANELVNFKVLMLGGKRFKLVTAIDRYAASAARAFETGGAGLVDAPSLVFLTDNGKDQQI